MNKLLTAALVCAAGAAWGAAGVRVPVGPGRFYPAKPRALEALVDRQLAAAMGQRLAADTRVVGLLVPHAGIEYSGSVAARAFALLRKGEFDGVIVIGTSHYRELDGAALYPGAYGTPAGSMPYDAALARRLMAATPLIKADAAAHRREHSIEVEIPFLRRVLGPVPLVALLMNTQDLQVSRRIGRAIAEVAKGRRLLLVASSDQSHFPSGAVAETVDATTLLALRSMDPAYFWLTNRLLLNRGIPNLAVTYCGEGAVMAVLEASRALGADRARVLARLNSGDVVSERDYNHVVGYAAVALTREPGEPTSPLALTARDGRRLLAAARQTLARAGGGAAANVPLSGEAVFNLPAAVALTLRDASGQTLGESVTARPQESLLEAVVHAAAGLAGPKAAGVKLELSVLSPLREAAAAAVRPDDGVVVELDGRAGVALPADPAASPTADAALDRACGAAGLKAGCWRAAGAKTSVFSVQTFSE